MVANSSGYESLCQLRYAVLVGDGFSYKNTTMTIGVIIAVISPITVMSNFLMLIAIYRYYTHGYGSILSLVNLSVCSLLTGLIAQPLYSTIYLNNLMAVHHCGMILSFEIVIETLISCTFLTLCCVGFERFISIFYPFKEARLLTQRKRVIIILVIWCFSSLSSLMLLISNEMEEIFHHIDLILTVLGTLWMVFVYLRVLLLVGKIRRRVADSEKRFSTKSMGAFITQKRRRTWITVFVISIMVFFHAIYDIVIILDKIFHRKTTSQIYLKVCQCVLSWALFLYLSSSIAIPVTIWLSNGRIRMAMKTMYVTCCLYLVGSHPILCGMNESKTSKVVPPSVISRRHNSACEMPRQMDTPAVLYHES